MGNDLTPASEHVWGGLSHFTHEEPETRKGK